MAKLLAITIIVIAVLSAIPIVAHIWEPPADVARHGPAIDRQTDETMWEAGLCFLAGQIVLAIFIWKYAGRGRDRKIGYFPGGGRGLVIAAFLIVGTEVLALGAVGTKSWGNIYFTPIGPEAMPVQVQAGQFAFYFRYPGPDGKFGPIHPQLISEANENFFGLDTQNDAASRDDIVTAEMAIPVDREIHLLMHSKDLGHSFYVPALRIQQDFVPGLDLSIHFTADKIGRYEIVCTQLCGLGHYNMKAYLEVMSEQDFNDWLKKEAALQ
jgi:cytochrome c oxidase subunit II